MKIKTFLQTAHTFKEHELLMKFHESIPLDIVNLNIEGVDPLVMDKELEQADGYTECDVGIMFGSWKGREKGHHISRTSVAQNSKIFLVFETPLLNRTTDGKHAAYRIGINHFLNNAGTFIPRGEEYSKERLEEVWKIQWKGWQNSEFKNAPILLLMQLPGDASLRGTNIFHWTYDAVKELRLHTDRPIRIRPHPMNNLKDGDEFFQLVTKITLDKIPNMEFSNSKLVSLKDDLKGAYCSVAFTSGSAIDSILNGVPVIATDPGNFAFEVSSNFVSDVNNLRKESPTEINRWLSNLAYHQWTDEEIQNGRAWKHLFPIIKNKMRSAIELAMAQPKGKKR